MTRAVGIICASARDHNRFGFVSRDMVMERPGQMPTGRCAYSQPRAPSMIAAAISSLTAGSLMSSMRFSTISGALTSRGVGIGTAGELTATEAGRAVG